MYLRLFIQLLRPKVAILLLLFLCVGMASAQQTISISSRLVLMMASLATWYVNATAINDLADENIDKINLKDAVGRPLVRRNATRATVRLMAAASGVIALILAMVASREYGVVIAAGLVLNIVYSLPPLQISHRGILAPLILPFGYVVIPFLGGYTLSKGSLDGWLLAACYVGFMARIILKDFRDIRGDTRYGKRTFVVRHGKRATCGVSLLMWIVSNALFWRALPFEVWVLLQPLWILVTQSLYSLSRTAVFRAEQIHIGLLARLANGMLIAVMASLLSLRTGKLLTISAVVALFVLAHLQALRSFEQVEIGYKG